MTAASKYGATAEIARMIGQVLAQRGVDATVTPPEEVSSVEDYDAVVLGSAVYAGRWMPSAKQVVDRAADALTSRSVWLFSSGPIGEPLKPEEDPVDATEMTERTNARGHRVFAGKLSRKQLSFPEKAIVIALRAQDGDFRDWDEIKKWAHEIADALEPGS